MDVTLKWFERLTIAVKAALDESGSDSIPNMNHFAESMFLSEKGLDRKILAKRMIVYDAGVVLRKLPSQANSFLPKLLNGYVERNGQRVSASQLSAEDWDVKILKIDKDILSRMARRAAYVEARDAASEHEEDIA